MKISFLIAQWPARTLSASDLKIIQIAVAAHTKAYAFNAQTGVAFLSQPAIKDLNATYRGKLKATNILSFPQFAGQTLKRKKDDQAIYIGDIALCLPIIAKEAKSKKIALKKHLTHLIVHGALHLLGFDHESEKDAQRMEALEVAILRDCGIANPYLLAQF